MAIVSKIGSFECSVVGRGGSRTAPTDAVIMKQAGSSFSKNEAPENESPGACFCLSLLFTEIEQKNFISLL